MANKLPFKTESDPSQKVNAEQWSWDFGDPEFDPAEDAAVFGDESLGKSVSRVRYNGDGTYIVFDPLDEAKAAARALMAKGFVLPDRGGPLIDHIEAPAGKVLTLANRRPAADYWWLSGERVKSANGVLRAISVGFIRGAGATMVLTEDSTCACVACRAARKDPVCTLEQLLATGWFVK